MMNRSMVVNWSTMMNRSMVVNWTTMMNRSMVVNVRIMINRPWWLKARLLSGSRMKITISPRILLNYWSSHMSPKWRFRCQWSSNQVMHRTLFNDISKNGMSIRFWPTLRRGSLDIFFFLFEKPPKKFSISMISFCQNSLSSHLFFLNFLLTIFFITRNSECLILWWVCENFGNFITFEGYWSWYLFQKVTRN